MTAVSQNMESDNGGTRSGSDTLLVLQPKSFRSFNNKDEYLYAMKEDLADWFTCLYKIEINGDIFFEVIETGILLCQHANEVMNFTKERRQKGIEIIMKSYFVRNIPEDLIQYKENNVKPGSFLARDNISNFISWCRRLGIPDDLRFETEDLVTRKNEKSVILCLLEVARVGAKLGMLAPTLVRMEEEIDAELAGEPPPQIITCDLKSLDEMVRHLVGLCSCPIQFSMIKVGDGKYQVGESRTLIFVRILRDHVMVRVGGGWNTLERYLDKHDPCRCSVHRTGQNGMSPVHRATPRKQTTNNVSSSANTPSTPRKQLPTNNVPSTNNPSSRSKSPSPASSQNKSSSPGTWRLPSHLSTIPQDVQTSQNDQRSQISRRSLSPSSSRSQSAGPGSTPNAAKSRSLPQTPAQRKIMARKNSGTMSPSATKPSTRSSTPKGILNKTVKRQKSLDCQESPDNMEMEKSLEEITSMTLEEFKNLLNTTLTVSNGAASQNSDSPRSQESSDSFRNQTKSFVRHGKDSEKGPSWKNVREKTRNICNSVTNQNYQRNSNNNRDSTDNYNNDSSRPKTPTSTLRPKTPTSSSRIKSAYSSTQSLRNSNCNNSRPSPSRSSEEDLAYTGYMRSRTPSKASSFSSLDDDESSEIAYINNCGISRSSKESSPAESVDKPGRSRTPGISGIPRPSTPSGIPRSTTPSGIPRALASGMSPKPTSSRMSRKQSLPESQIFLSRSSTPQSSPHPTRRSKTPVPITDRSRVINRSITPGPRESWNKSVISRKNTNEDDRANRNVARSLDFTNQDSENNDDHTKKANTLSSESGSTLKKKIMALSEKRRRSTSSGPRSFSKTDTGDKDVLTITRGKGGGHSVTVESNGSTTYQSSKPATSKTTKSSGYGMSNDMHRRSKTPDPGLYNGRTRLIDPKIMARRNSGGTTQNVDKRLEAWVDSTINQTKHKLPKKPRRSMTPNSLEITEQDLLPRPSGESQAILEPLYGKVCPVEDLVPLPADPEMFMKMEKLWIKYRELELKSAENETVADDAVEATDEEEMCINDSVSNKSSKSPSTHSNQWSWSNPGSSRSSGSPAPGVEAGSNDQTETFTSSKTIELSDLDNSLALVSKIKQILKVRPRNESKSGPKSRIPAPSSLSQKSRSCTNLFVNPEFSMSGGEDKPDSHHGDYDFSQHSDEISELSQMTSKFCEESSSDLNRSETPVPKLATPLTTGRCTVISKSNSSSKLVRAMSQEPIDHSRSNSLSSISSRLSLSNTDEDLKYL